MRKTVLALAPLLSPAAAVLATSRLKTMEKETAAASVARPAAQE